ncbi:MAG: BON domain-containing protein [Actinomycetota bacterium]|nr:BON domain-containing protein [Actinomycetota bacterium]
MDAPAEPKHYLVGHIREALAQDARVNELTIQVTIAGEKIFLTGNVATAERRDAITEVVGEVAPGYNVHNETTVQAYEAAPDAETLS